MSPPPWSTAVVVLALASAAAACAPAPAAPADAVVRSTPPPWDAPRDAISHIRSAGLPELRTGFSPAEQRTAILTVVYDGEEVAVPAYVGIDRVRATEAPIHTHADDGRVWIEDVEPGNDYTVGEFFDLWGVRLDDDCLADACGSVTVTVDGVEVDADVRDVVWADGQEIRVDGRR